MTKSLMWRLVRVAVAAICLSSAGSSQSRHSPPPGDLPARVAHLEDTLRSVVQDGQRSDLAERVRHWTEVLHEETAGMSAPDTSEPGVVDQHVQNALMAARAINRAMISHGFSASAQREWQAIRRELNRIAEAYRRPTIRDVVLLTRVSPAAPLIGRREVSAAMQTVDGAVDGLKDALHGQWGKVLGEIQRSAVDRWIDDLENSTNAMASLYRAKRVPEYYFKVEEALMIASGLNPIMDNGSNGALAARWRTLRRVLNQLARTFAFPPLDVNAIPRR